MMNGKVHSKRVKQRRNESPKTTIPSGGVRRVCMSYAIEAVWRRPRLRSRKRGGTTATQQLDNLELS